MPFYRLPVLFVDGAPLAQSHAIARFLARRFGFNGADSWEEAQVDAIADQFKDFQQAIHPYFMVKNRLKPGNLEQLHEEVFLPNFRKNYGFFTKSLCSSASGFLVGSSMTWIDLLIAQNTSSLSETELLHFSELAEHQKRIHEIPSIKQWIQSISSPRNVSIS